MVLDGGGTLWHCPCACTCIMTLWGICGLSTRIITIIILLTRVLYLGKFLIAQYTSNQSCPNKARCYYYNHRNCLESMTRICMAASQGLVMLSRPFSQLWLTQSDTESHNMIWLCMQNFPGKVPIMQVYNNNYYYRD